MDTRDKIIDLARAAEIAADMRTRGVRLNLIAAYFDVLTPDHIRRLRGLSNGQPLIAAVLDPPEPLLAPRARAELAASLSMVDYVVLVHDSGLDQAIEQIQPHQVVREEAADQRRTQALIEHVHRRQRS